MTHNLFEDESLISQHRRLLELLRHNAFAMRDVVLSSGRRSNFYIDCKQVSLSAEGHFLVGQLFYALITRHAPKARAVGGLTMGADPLASATSLVSFLAGRPLSAFLVRKDPKGHGTDQWLEGASNLRPGTEVAIVEDVVTTGASTLRAIERAEAAGLIIAHVVALVDREEEGGREAIHQKAPLTALYSKRDFLP